MEVRPLAGYEKRYLIDTEGNVYSLFCSGKRGLRKTPRLMRIRYTKAGYNRVRLYTGKGNKPVQASVHRLVLKTFAPCENMDNLQVDHKDNNRLNNKLENLHWVTPLINNHRKKLHGTFLQGEKIPWSKLKEDDVLRIRDLYSKGYYLAELARLFNVSAEHIKNIIIRKKWKHI